MNTQTASYILVATAAMSAFIVYLMVKLSRRKPGRASRRRKVTRRHESTRASADSVLSKLREIDSAREDKGDLSWFLSYLRKINPFVFEELLLLSFERKGYRIRRNERYTGDGGVDGRVWIGEELWLIQAKRYRNGIKKEHLEEFCSLCLREGCHGYFIHTGKTPKTHYDVIKDCPQVEIISGRKLHNLILN